MGRGENKTMVRFSDANSLCETVSFGSIQKMQPFLVSITTSSVLLMDFHCHLTKHEVCGYLGGTWDINSHSKSASDLWKIHD